MAKEVGDPLVGVGARMRALREQRKIGLRALARMVEVTPSLISQIETGKINPSVSSLYAIATALDVPMDFFFGSVSAAPGGTAGLVEPVGVIDAEGIGHDAVVEQRPTMAEAVRQRDARMQKVRAEEQGHARARAPGSGTAVVRHAARRRIVIDGYGGTVLWELLTRDHDPGADFLEIRYDPGASSAQHMLRHTGREYGLVFDGVLTVTLAFEEFVLEPGDSIAFDSSTPHRLSNRGTVPARAIWVVTNRQPLGAPTGAATE
ncbi:MAG: XRE family transcriptional regulator [Actinobacteria bacterium]|nr:XRE family transcriptional regulator [Actinomycetota bacterium]